MMKEAPSPEENQEMLLSQQDQQLLQRQRLLQDEAQHVLEELNLIELRGKPTRTKSLSALS